MPPETGTAGSGCSAHAARSSSRGRRPSSTFPGAASSLAAILCVPQTPPTIWVRDDVIDELELWDVLQQLVREYDAGTIDDSVWSPVLDGTGHLAVIGDGRVTTG